MSHVTVYWESRDGLAWEAPQLGIVQFDGSTANNVIMGMKGRTYGSAASVVQVPKRLRSRGRFAMLYDGDWLKSWNFQHMTTLTGDQTDASID